jgi:Zn-dependent protease
MFRQGYFLLGNWRGAPVRAHWSVLLGVFALGGWQPRLTALLASVTLVLVHEFGHAVLVRRARGEVHAIELTALGGECQWSGEVTAVERACIAWGGVWAQGLVYVGALLYLRLEGPPTSREVSEVLHVFTRANVMMMALNLMPIPPLDGSKAWRLFPLLWQKMRVARYQRRAREKTLREQDVRRRLVRLERAEQENVSPEAREAVSRFLEEVRRTGKQ